MAKQLPQTLIVRIPAETNRRIVHCIDSPDSPYGSIDEFIRVAVENQLTIEGAEIQVSEELTASDALPLQLRPERLRREGNVRRLDPPDRMSTSPSPTLDGENLRSVEEFLRLPDLDGVQTREPSSATGAPLSSFTNRLAPLLAGPRVLANLSASGSAPSADTYLDVTARASRAFGLRLRDEDDEAGRRGRHRRSIAWPVSEDESKSLIRYRNCFMFTPDKKVNFAGPLLELRLITIVGGKVYLTSDGANFASASSAALDQDGGVDVLSDAHRSILSEAIVQIPGESIEIRQFLDALDAGCGLQDDVDQKLQAGHHTWSEAQVVSHRAAMVGRLRDLDVIDVETLPEAKVTIVPAMNFGFFTGLIGRQASLTKGEDK